MWRNPEIMRVIMVLVEYIFICTLHAASRPAALLFREVVETASEEQDSEK